MRDKGLLTVTLIQADLAWEDKAANLQHLQEKIDGIAEQTEIIVLPEMFATGFSMNAAALAEPMNGQVVNWVKEMSVRKNAAVVGSVIIRENEHYYNRLLWVLPNGAVAYYDKHHLFGYSDEHRYYTSGQKKLVASIKGWKINLQVCYDLRFPVWNRQSPAENERYDVYINVASWPASRRMHWMTLLRARAIENQCYVVGVNRVGEDGKGLSYSGDSSVIDPMGNLLYQNEGEEKIFSITLKKEVLNQTRSRFPFLDDADRYVILE